MKNEHNTQNLMNRRAFLGGGTAAASLLATGALNRAWAARADSTGPVVTTAAGRIRGASLGKVKAFKGVSYGAPTEGPARFMPPAKPQPWTGVKDALELGPAAPQNPSNLVPESLAQRPKSDGEGTEDCRHLNVWTPNPGSGN